MKATATQPDAKASTGHAPSVALVQGLAKLARTAQQVSISHFKGDDDFKANGLRSYARYRDLGVEKATSGLVQAHVIRMLPPCTDQARSYHLHATVFQMIYVLKGWIKVKLEDRDPVTMNAGTCWTQPPSIKHAVLDYSGDFEALEIILPADFATEAAG